ncbi:MAG TPA: hypothetical protein VFI24_23555 [Pyrinomonadaceae bacterium]|nr:hypothetical protein [Pyrinomonadaceae bacterium]
MTKAKTTKKSKKGATKKMAAGQTSKLRVSTHKLETMLMNAENTPSQFNGSVHFEAVASFLVSSSSSLLVMYRPQGNYSPADIGAAASFLRHGLGKDEGDPLTVLGYPANLFGQQSILMVSAN